MKSVPQNNKVSKTTETEKVEIESISIEFPVLDQADPDFINKNMDMRTWYSNLKEGRFDKPPWETGQWTNGASPDKENKHNSEAVKRLGPANGKMFYFSPRLLSYHKWIFREQLNSTQRDILDLLLTLNEGEIRPSLGTLFKYTGIRESNLSKNLKLLTENSCIKCPVCGLKTNLIEISKRTTKSGLEGNVYHLGPLLDFLVHIRDHWKDERDKYDLAFNDMLANRRSGRGKNFKKRNSQF
jgi:hypothetical protein